MIPALAEAVKNTKSVVEKINNRPEHSPGSGGMLSVSAARTGGLLFVFMK